MVVAVAEKPAYSFPSPLYRFEQVSKEFEREKQTFLDHLMHFETPRNFNDPFDARPHFRFSRDTGMTLAEVTALIKRNAPGVSQDRLEALAESGFNKLNDPEQQKATKAQLRAGIQDHFNNTTMKCFGEKRASVLQWSHYANKHKGYAVGYCFEKIWPYARKNGQQAGIAISRVNYSEKYPSIDLDAEPDSPEFRDALLECLRTKSKLWEYENEWRAMRVDSIRGLQAFPEDSIKEVVFGALMEDKHKEGLRAMFRKRKHPINLFQAATEDDRFELRFESIGTSHD